jgi:hypothetical protein
MIIAVQIMSAMGDWHTIRPCAQIAYVSEDDARSYAECAAYFAGSNPDALAIVHVNFSGTTTEIGASLGVPFGMAVWLGLAIHAIGVEFYVSIALLTFLVYTYPDWSQLNLTSSETERLRVLSAERRAEAGMLSQAEKSDNAAGSRKASASS